MTQEQIQTLTDVFIRCCTHADWPTIYVQDTPYSVATIETMLGIYGIKYTKKTPRNIKFENFGRKDSPNLPYKETPLVIDEDNKSNDYFDVYKIVHSLEHRLRNTTNIVAREYLEAHKNEHIKQATNAVQKRMKPTTNTLRNERS